MKSRPCSLMICILKQNKKLTVEAAVLGLGRLASKEELVAFFTEDEEDLNLIPSDEGFKKYKP